jgi:hypothetical protein
MRFPPTVKRMRLVSAFSGQVGGTLSSWQGLVPDKVFGNGACVREITLGEAANFVGAGGEIHDGVGAVKKRVELRS